MIFWAGTSLWATVRCAFPLNPASKGFKKTRAKIKVFPPVNARLVRTVWNTYFRKTEGVHRPGEDPHHRQRPGMSFFHLVNFVHSDGHVLVQFDIKMQNRDQLDM
jgi:hypothetical protein